MLSVGSNGGGSFFVSLSPGEGEQALGWYTPNIHIYIDTYVDSPYSLQWTLSSLRYTASDAVPFYTHMRVKDMLPSMMS